MGYALLWKLTVVEPYIGIIQAWAAFDRGWSPGEKPTKTLLGDMNPAGVKVLAGSRDQVYDWEHELRMGRSRALAKPLKDPRLATMASLTSVNEDPVFVAWHIKTDLNADDSQMLDEHGADDWIDLYEKTGEAGALDSKLTPEFALVPSTFASAIEDAKGLLDDGWSIRQQVPSTKTPEESLRISELRINAEWPKLLEKIRRDPRHTRDRVDEFIAEMSDYTWNALLNHGK